MSISLYLQLIFYDRPRDMHVARSKIHKKLDIKLYIETNYAIGKIRDLLLFRFRSMDKLLSQIECSKISWVDIQDDAYPPYFHQLNDPPLVIFYKGDINIALKKTLGIVGTRCPSLMAIKRMELIFSKIKNTVIVSGGALGIDSYAHQLALDNQLPTIAILACGLDLSYPKSNTLLFSQIIEFGGCILSEYPMTVSPKPYYFPQRNRLIASLSSKLIVVEAAKRSGAVLTANIASNLAVDVAAMVGSFNAPESEGCYSLINDGAKIIGNIYDFCSFINQSYEVQQTFSGMKYHGIEDIIMKKIPNEPIHLEELAKACSLSINEMIEYITTLSLNDDVVISSGHMVSRHEF